MDPVETSGIWPTYDTGILRQIEALQSTGWFGALLGNLIEAPYNILFALTHPGLWLDWTDKVSISRVVYYGGSIELLFVFLFLFLLATIIGLIRPRAMWSMVRGSEAFSNLVGRIAAWAGLIMVLQQILIIFMQRVFATAEISIGFGMTFTKDLSWWGEELKLYNALVLVLCLAYTFVQRGHVRVDLLYAPASFRAKRIIDMVGSLVLMLPMGVIVWFYGWFYMWRHLIVPKPSASDNLERLINKSRALRWNVETTGFSPNGFNGYFIFKVLMITMAAMIILQAVTFFFRSLMELREGPASAGKYLDLDPVDESAPIQNDAPITASVNA